MSRWHWLLIVSLAAAQLGGCATAVLTGTGQGTNREAADMDSRMDAQTTAAVNQVLARDSEIPALDIRVRTHSGVVTLTGRVPSFAAAERAEALAEQVPGVERVRVKLDIGP